MPAGNDDNIFYIVDIGVSMRALPKVAWLLGYGGVIPFVLLTLLLVAPVQVPGIDAAMISKLLLAYAAIIISFIGAVHWGIALMLDDSDEQELLMYYSVIPALSAWLMMLLPQQVALISMAGLVVIAYFMDRVLIFRLMKYDYARLRLHLSVAVGSSLLVAGLAS